MFKNKLITGICLVTFALSCTPDKLNKTNPNQLTPDNFYKNASELTKAVNSIYAMIQSNSLVSREYFFLHDLRSDDVATGGGQLETPRNQLLIGAQAPDNSVGAEVWNGCFRTIFRANTVIEYAPNAVDFSSPTVERLVGEAKFLRAWAYMELVTLWGGVPMPLGVPTSTTSTLARSSEAEVYTQIKKDLTEAQVALPLKYSGSELGRATQGAAQMLLARAYMNQGDYTNAKGELQKMISSGTYSLQNIKYADNFREENEWNNESVFEIGFASIGEVNWVGDGDDPSWGNQEGTTRTQEYSATGWRNLIPSNSLIAEFESTFKGDAKTDPRRVATFWVIGDKYNNSANTLADGQVQGNTSAYDGTTTKVSWAKYTLQYKSDPGGYKIGGINHRVMRYADAVLMMAECENELGNSAAAIARLNETRNRADVMMPNYPTARYPCGNKEETFAAVRHERRVELSGEQVRNRDLLRWLKNGKITAGPIATFKPLLPIPQSEIDNNDKLTQQDQNPGY